MARKKKTLKTITDENYQRRKIIVGNYTVIEASMRESIRRANMLDSVRRYIESHPDDAELKDFLYVYPFIAGCTHPLISIEQFLEIHEGIAEKLSQAAMDVNPHWFTLPNQEKKTEILPIEFTNNSEN